MGARKTTRAFVKAREEFKSRCKEENAPCWLDGMHHIDYDAPFDDYKNDDRFQLDHVHPVSTHPELQHDPTNWRASAAGCNRERGNDSPHPPLGLLSRQWS